MFWDMIMKYETLILVFVRAHRDKDFALYVAVLEELAVLFFALDHVNKNLNWGSAQYSTSEKLLFL